MNIRTALLLLIILLAAFSTSSGQNMLSEPPEKIEIFVSENYPGMVQDRSFRNEHYRYLKFTDSSNNSRTILFFLSDLNKCNAVRYVYETGAKNEVVADLNRKYTYTGDNRWWDRASQQNASVELIDEEWFITVTVRPIEKENGSIL